MGCPVGFVLDPSGAVCVPAGDGTDPSYFPPPSTGDISYGGDPSISFPQVNGDGCYIGETDPITGDTIANCGAAGGGGVNPSGITPTSISPSMWQSIGGTLGAFLGGFTKFGSAPSSVPVGSKRCSNGQIVPSSSPCPGVGVSASSLGSSGSLTIILLLGIVLIIVFALRK